MLPALQSRHSLTGRDPGQRSQGDREIFLSRFPGRHAGRSHGSRGGMRHCRHGDNGRGPVTLSCAPAAGHAGSCSSARYSGLWDSLGPGGQGRDQAGISQFSPYRTHSFQGRF